MLRHDAALVPAPGMEWFDRDWWARQGQLQAGGGGRGGIAFIETPAGPCALRHCHRGGLAARFSNDRYLWAGARRVRSFAEFELLARMLRQGLPVPAPVAAGCQRQGLWYRADLITRRIAADTLATRLHRGRIDMALAGALGTTIARFHGAGVQHADLNVENILVDAGNRVWLLDFDRGRIRRPARRWQQASLARLQRSIAKLGQSAEIEVDAAWWQELNASHDAQLARLLR